MKLSILVVTYNAAGELPSCLRALFESGRPQSSSFQVIVADNASSDGTRECLEEFPDVELLPLDENLGFGRANNRALQRAEGELVLFLNPDTVVQEGAIDRMIAILDRRPEVGALGPLLRNEDGSVQLSYGRNLGFTAEFLQKCLNFGYRNGKGPLRGWVERRAAKENRPDWVSGACLMTRRKLLEDLGGFDEGFFLYAEDVDLCARIRAARRAILYSPEASVMHLGGRAADRHPDIARVESQRSRLYFYSKHYGRLKAKLFKSYLALKLSIAWLVKRREHPLQRKLFAVLRDY